jgi:hypothetical protein
MKKLKYIFITICTLFVVSCTQQDIEPFGEESYLYFEKFWKDAPAPGTEKSDSTRVTFFFTEDNEKFVYADLKVVLAGRKPEKDLEFKLKVVDDFTTANSDEYVLEDFYTFKAKDISSDAKQIEDIIRIKILKSERIINDETSVYLGLEIVPTDDIKVGQYERSRAILYITKDPVKPVWWDREVETVLLGVYSAKKYKLFLQNVEGAEELDGDMIKNYPDRARQLVFEFKKWLNENPTIDDVTGELMTVEI